MPPSQSPRRGGGPVVAVVGAVGLVVLGAGQFGPVRSHIESDLTSRSTSALAAAGLTGVRVRFSGRDATLTGTVASSAELDQALTTVRSLEGVRVADADPTLSGTPSVNPTPTPTATPTPTVSSSPTPSPTSSPTPTSTPTPTASSLAAQLRTLPAITFRTDSSRLTPSGRAAVHLAAAMIKSAGAGTIRIEGYTDDRGPTGLNRRLSLARAASVQLALEQLGVPAARLVAVGRGKQHPLFPNDTSAHRAANRRAAFTVLA